jgi:ABC-type bacteriocin/lantibiotic exporter with double-glycine peptidase domain
MNLKTVVIWMVAWPLTLVLLLFVPLLVLLGYLRLIPRRSYPSEEEIIARHVSRAMNESEELE